jgi:alcohol dehydrogenase (cytochrome c)
MEILIGSFKRSPIFCHANGQALIDDLRYRHVNERGNAFRAASTRPSAAFEAAQESVGGLIFLALLDGTVAAYDENTLDELWKINVGAGFTAPPMTFEVNGRQYLAIASGSSAVSRAKLVNTPELGDQRQATVLYVFAL